MAHLEKVQETPHETSNKEEANTPSKDGLRGLRIATVVVCIVNFAYVGATAVLIGKLKGWLYSIHCFILSLSFLLSFVQTLRAETKLKVKLACWGSCSTLGLVLTTTFTLLIRQVYYHPSPLLEPKWVLFSLQAGIIPLLGGILVMYECSIIELYEDRYILMIAILDFADIWDMASMLSQHKAPFLKEESSLEIAVQFFCSFSIFNMFSFLILKNIIQEVSNLICKYQTAEQDKAEQKKVQKKFNSRCKNLANLISQLYQNIPFSVIRILLLVNHGFLDFDYLAKNVISVILCFLDCCSDLRMRNSYPEMS